MQCALGNHDWKWRLRFAHLLIALMRRLGGPHPTVAEIPIGGHNRPEQRRDGPNYVHNRHVLGATDDIDQHHDKARQPDEQRDDGQRMKPVWKQGEVFRGFGKRRAATYSRILSRLHGCHWNS